MTGRSLLWATGLMLAALPVSALMGQNVSEQYLLAAANSDRAAQHLPPLRAEEHLAQAARTHAEQMADHGTISHQFTGEPALDVRAADAGAHFSLVTENVAEAATASQIHDLWMASEGHRANLLDPGVNMVGIAVVQRGRQLYAVEDFGRSVEQLSLDQQEEKVAGLLSAAGLQVDSNKADARQSCTMTTGYAGQRQPGFVMRFSSSDLNRLPDQLASRLSSGKYHVAEVGACVTGKETSFSGYNVAVMLFQ